MINSLPVDTHEDDRRVLVEWVKDFSLRTCKVIILKKDTSIGNHYHKKKDEIFFLLQGKGEVELDGEREPLKLGDVVFAGKGTKHTFHLIEGSILLEAGTKPFDKSDDYK